MIHIDTSERWAKARLSSLFFENGNKNSDFSEQKAFQFYFGAIVPKKEYELTDDLVETYKKYTVVRPGDIMINGLNLNYDFVTQRVGLVNDHGIITSAYLSLRPRSDINTKYYCYLFKTVDARKMFHGLGSGIRLTLSFKDIKNFRIPVPSREEQDQIVRFLDWKVSEINRLVSIRKKQVSAYKELRKAVIDQGILHGFAKTDSKDSGINWLGMIPERWEVLPIKRICRVNASISDAVNRMNNSTMVTFLPMENVTETGKIDCTIKKPIAEVKTGFSSFAKGDVVVAKITPCFENGKGACLDDLDTDIGFGTTEFINLRPAKKVLSKYLYMITMTRPFRMLGEEVMTGSAGQKRVPVSFIKSFTLGIPSIEEQGQILRTIDEKLSLIDKAIETESKRILLLQELKERIISDVVTGKIDVRDISIPEYEYVDEDVDSGPDSEDNIDEDEEQED